MDEWQVIAEISRTITSIGILLIWVRSERQDNLMLWRIIEKLTDASFRKLEDEDKHKPH